MSTETERQEFEAWVKSEKSETDLRRYPMGVNGYKDLVTQAQWQAWKAAKAIKGGSDPVATTLQSDPEFPDPENDGPIFSRKDWSNLGSLPAGTRLYTHPAASVSAQQAEADQVACAAAIGFKAGCGYSGNDMHLDAAKFSESYAAKVSPTATTPVVPDGMIKIHDWLLMLSTYPDDYPMDAMQRHLGRLQREMSELIAAAPQPEQEKGHE